jgi:selenide,water dikinase
MQRNRDFRKKMVNVASTVPEYLQDVLFDPQTSGGLLIAVSKTKASRLLGVLHKGGVSDATIVGEVVARPKNKVVVK